jgi:uncharacterized protein (TIGR00255 family)
MTAFARQESSSPLGALTWEIRSVNHRYLEPSIRLPEDFRAIESKIREKLGQRLNRGKLECNLSFKPEEGVLVDLHVNEPLAARIATLATDIGKHMSDPAPVSAMDILRWPGVLENPKPDTEVLYKSALQALDQALDELIETRVREGQKLCEALNERVVIMRDLVKKVRERLPDVLDNVRNRLVTRFAELSQQLDPDRLEQEMLLLTQKSDVEEELKRLETHFDELERILGNSANEAVGRRLDFLMQELNREANTLCSKSMDAETTRAGIDMKVLIEQMREQVQNVE